MDEEYSVPLQSLIDEFSFEPVCLPRPASEIYVKTTELNRPGLALSGFFELFEPERIQLIGSRGSQRQEYSNLHKQKNCNRSGGKLFIFF